MNHVVLVGRLTAVPELKQTPNGVSVASFTVAVDRPYRTNGEKQADFIPCVSWRKTAEFISHYFTKGQMIGLVGSIQTRKYQDKQGNNRTAIEVLVEQANFIGGKSNGGENTEATASANDFGVLYSDEDDLPF